MIVAEGLCKSYDTPVLRDVSFTCGEEILCIMAPSGVGKTTLLRLLLGLEKPDSGRITPAGCRWAAVFQENRLLDQMDALGNLRFALGSGLDEDRAERLMAELGLNLRDPKPTAEYSGGMKRRLALCRALLAESDALALDEPFTGLDEESRKCAISCIRRYGAGKPVLLVTHDARDAEAAGARILQLEPLHETKPL